MAAVNCELLTNVVARVLSFQFTSAPETNPVPFTVRTNAAVPAVAFPGESELIVGTGFGALITKAALPEVPPPGAALNTVTCAVPAVAISAAAMLACS